MKGKPGDSTRHCGALFASQSSRNETEKLRSAAKSEIGCVGNALMNIRRGSNPAMRMMPSHSSSLWHHEEQSLSASEWLSSPVGLISPRFIRITNS